MRFVAVLLGAAALASSAQAQPAGVDAVFADFQPTTPGCALGVKSKDQAPVLRGYGSADLEHAVPITPDTIFEAGSVSKQFTAAAILLLVEDGRIALSDDIRKYLPEVPDYGRPITIDMLLSHTSGLRDWGSVMDIAGWPRTSRVYTPVEVLQIASRQKALNYPPGEAYSYTNTGYNLAAWIVLRVSGQSLADFTRARIFEPLGMSRTSWRDNYRRVVPGRAIAYGPGPGGLGQDMPFENTYGHGGLLTTVGDLLTWNEALTQGRLGKAVSARLQEQAVLTGGRKIAYGRGLVSQAFKGQAEIAHSGATAGYRAWLARFPGQGLSVAVLCNTAGANAVRLGRRVAELHLPPGPAAPTPIAQPADELERLPGVYVDERTGSVLRVVAENGGLSVRGAGAFAPAGKGRYRGGDMDWVFGPDAVERRAADGETVRYRRVTPVTPTAAELGELAGAYSSLEANGVLLATIRGGALVLAPADRPSAPVVARPLYKDAFQGDDGLIRVVRGPDGKVTGLRFTGARVYSLEFRRIEAS
ncbi:serine hydrolase domain-containing protein [Phenylobacterium sp.]|uniref:serine hydrolase domain-containing protein n=1 Tax=Phenylobacterium sp. TaxID=1871053 RepID=UPI002EDA315E